MTYPQGQTLSRPFTMSLIGHGLLILFFYLWNAIMGPSEIDLKSNNNFKVIQSSVKVDVVAMPKFTIKELKHMELNAAARPAPTQEKTAPIPKVENPDAPELKQVVKKKSFAERMKELSKKRVKVKAVKSESSKKDTKKDVKTVDTSKLRKIILAGNKVSQGSALTGNVSSQDLDDFGQYASTLPDHVRKFWKLPSYLLDKDYKCRIQIFIEQNGSLIKAHIIETSGNEDFDARALRAVKLSNPFPIPPSTYVANRLMRGEVVMGFPL